MRDPECIFCKIVEGSAPSYKIYEDDKHIAFLDIFPNTEGQSLLITKDHLPSLFSSIEDKELADFMLAAKKVANQIRQKLGVGRVHAVLEGTGVNHLHAKLYPAVGTKDEFKEFIAPEKALSKEYQGYISTLMGPRASDAALEKLQRKLK